MNSLRIRKKKNIKIVYCKFFALLFDPSSKFYSRIDRNKIIKIFDRRFFFITFFFFIIYLYCVLKNTVIVRRRIDTFMKNLNTTRNIIRENTFTFHFFDLSIKSYFFKNKLICMNVQLITNINFKKKIFPFT